MLCPRFDSDHEDSTRYVKLLHTVFDQSLVFRDWLQFTESDSGAAVQGDNSWPANKAAIDEHLLKISEFFYCVICNMVIRGQKQTHTIARGDEQHRGARYRCVVLGVGVAASVLPSFSQFVHEGRRVAHPVVPFLPRSPCAGSLFVVVCSSDLKSVLKRYIKHCMRTLVSH